MTLINLLAETSETITNTATLTTNELENVSIEAFCTMLNVNFDYVCWIKASTEEEARALALARANRKRLNPSSSVQKVEVLSLREVA